MVDLQSNSLWPVFRRGKLTPSKPAPRGVILSESCSYCWFLKNSIKQISENQPNLKMVLNIEFLNWNPYSVTIPTTFTDKILCKFKECKLWILIIVFWQIIINLSNIWPQKRQKLTSAYNLQCFNILTLWFSLQRICLGSLDRTV